MTFLVNAATYFKAEPHQIAALEGLEARLDKDTLEWFKAAYRAAQRPLNGKLLKVPYFFQNDNKSGTGYRECFSSSCAMLAAFYGRVKSDDEYNLIRQHFGDTTDLGAQVGALHKLRLEPTFKTNGNPATLEALLDEGKPVAVGWLHKGPVSAPSGGGHWSVIIGYTPTHFIFHDPNGEASLVSGGYVNTKGGKAVAYSRKNWLPRWEVDGKNTGWYLTCEPK